jgi:hypothetical protein
MHLVANLLMIMPCILSGNALYILLAGVGFLLLYMQAKDKY